ncbi:MAG: DUF4402 domain-containing protein [Erythrobacter sp.]|uniref:DUF4402 domain-containing protein n=1 Tax=Erythrobacter sp. TaxID=1042 RepID=UPI00262C9990|nr:DUF4402 domain-containing protein [Erythrobacter sp.]MDJ0978996.1 DUF4402 domain-containing protein [Erythrobacter sp.]
MFRCPTLTAALATIMVASLATPAPSALRAQGACEDCDVPPACREDAPESILRLRARNCQKLSVAIESDVDFGRVVVLKNGEGRVLLDLETGERKLLGDLENLGGVPITGRATVTGAPLERLRITLPTRVSMRDTSGGEAEISEFVTDLPALPTLDANGQLTFRFSGTLVLSAKMEASGRLRGRVPISVEYQ